MGTMDSGQLDLLVCPELFCGIPLSTFDVGCILPPEEYKRYLKIKDSSYAKKNEEIQDMKVNHVEMQKQNQKKKTNKLIKRTVNLEKEKNQQKNGQQRIQNHVQDVEKLFKRMEDVIMLHVQLVILNFVGNVVLKLMVHFIVKERKYLQLLVQLYFHLF